MNCHFSVVSEVIAKPAVTQTLFYVIFQDFQRHLCYIQVDDLCKRYKVSVSTLLFWNVQFWHHLFGKTILSPLGCLRSFVKGQLTIFVDICFQTLFSVPLIYLCIVWPAPHCLDYCSFMVILKVKQCQPSNSVFFFNIVLDIMSLLFSV